MTDAERDDLCRRIALAKPDWARLGMACRDGGSRACDTTLNTFRLVSLDDPATPRWHHPMGGYIHHTAPMGYAVALRRAIANGPDWRCEITVLGLLSLVPRHELRWARATNPMLAQPWAVQPDDRVPPFVGDTRTDAILLAVTAAVEAAKEVKP